MAEAVKVHAHQIEMIPLDALKGYERNARTHPEDQINSLVAIIRDAGFTNPLLVDDEDVIIAGHGRALAARKLKMTEVPCVRVSGLTEEQIKSLRISDNRVGLGSGWDDGLLKLELTDLQASGFDLSLTGFSSLELTGLFATREGDTDPDDAPEAPAVPVSRLGDLWRLGEHWLICGDCTDKATVEKVLGGARPLLMVTDPPYGVEYDPAWRSTEIPQVGKWKAPNRARGAVQNDGRADWREAWALFSGDVAYVWHSGKHGAVVQVSLEACEFEIRSQIVWSKTSFAVGRGHYHWQHETCLYGVRGNGHWAGDRKQSTVWPIEALKKSDTGHGTQKPVECMARPIRNNSKVGDHVYEPFSGSGTTIIAGQMNKRIVHAIELNPAYVDVAVRRWEQFTGEKAALETGESFEQVKARREAEAEAVV